MRKVFIYLCVPLFLHVFSTAFRHYDQVLSTEEDEDEEEERTMNLLFEKSGFTDSDLVLLIKELSKAPFTDDLRSNVWHKILVNDRATNLSEYQWKMLQPLIPTIPPEILLTVNFTDEMIQFFGHFEMGEEQLSVLAETVSRQWGENVYSSENHIMKMGNIFCGLSTNELDRIHQETLRGLLKRSFFKTVRGCTPEKLTLLSSRVQGYAVSGPPRTWQRDTIESMGMLLGGLNWRKIREIRSEFFTVFTPDLILRIPSENLQRLRPKQLRMLESSTLMAWRRKTRDLRPLFADFSSSGKSSPITVPVTLVLICLTTSAS